MDKKVWRLIQKAEDPRERFALWLVYQLWWVVPVLVVLFAFAPGWGIVCLVGGVVACAVLAGVIREKPDSDKRMAIHRGTQSAVSATKSARDVILATPLAVQGFVAKADGSVSREEARFARGTMVAMLAGMRGSRRDLNPLLHAFDHGQSPKFDLERAVAEFRDVATKRLDRGPLEDLFRGALGMAWVDGSVHPAQRRALGTLARGLGLSAGGVSVIEEMAATEALTGLASPEQELAAAQRFLGLGAFPTDDELEVAYRQMMDDCQRLAAEGFPRQINEEIVGMIEALHEAYALILSTR